MQKKTRSLLDELDAYLGPRDNLSLVESRGNHIITGAINLLKFMRENLSEDKAQDLEKRMLNSIRSGDPTKFSKGVRRAKSGTNKNKRIEGSDDEI